LRQAAGHIVRDAYGFAAAFGRGVVLSRALRGADNLAFRVVDFGTRGDAVEIEIGRNLRPGFAVAQRLGEKVLDFPCLRLFEGRAHVVLIDRSAAFGVCRTGEKAAFIVHDGNLRRLQLRDGGGDQMLDGGNLFAGQGYPAARLEKDAGRRRLRAVAEKLTLGQNEMNARRLDGRHRADGPGQFALQGAQVIDVLNEACCAESFLLVENFIADRAAFGETVGSHQHADFAHLFRVDADDPTAWRDFVGDFKGVQLLNDSAGVLLVELTIEEGHRRRRNPRRQKTEEGKKAERDDANGRQTKRAEVS